MLSDAVQIAVISGVSGILAGWVGVRGVDKVKNGRHGSTTANGMSVDRALAQRAEVEFQAKMTLLMTQLTAAIEKGHDKALTQMTLVSDAICDAANAIKQVHDEIVQHRTESRPAMQTTFDTGRTVKEIQRQLERNPPYRTGTGG
jgi:hypothetical protein